MTNVPEPQQRPAAGWTALDTSAFDNQPKKDYPDDVTIKHPPMGKESILAYFALYVPAIAIFALIITLIAFALEGEFGMYLFIVFMQFFALGMAPLFVIIVPLAIFLYCRSFTIRNGVITHQRLWLKNRFTITPDTIIVFYNPAGHHQRRLFLLDTRTRKHARFHFGSGDDQDEYLTEIMKHLRRLDLPYETRPLDVNAVYGPHREKYLTAFSPWEIWFSENCFTFLFILVPAGLIAFLAAVVFIVSFFQN